MQIPIASLFACFPMLIIVWNTKVQTCCNASMITTFLRPNARALSLQSVITSLKDLAGSFNRGLRALLDAAFIYSYNAMYFIRSSFAFQITMRLMSSAVTMRLTSSAVTMRLMSSAVPMKRMSSAVHLYTFMCIYIIVDVRYKSSYIAYQCVPYDCWLNTVRTLEHHWVPVIIPARRLDLTIWIEIRHACFWHESPRLDVGNEYYVYC